MGRDACEGSIAPDVGMAMSVSRQPSAAFVAGNDAPPIGERAATRERSEIIHQQVSPTALGCDIVFVTMAVGAAALPGGTGCAFRVRTRPPA